MKSWLHPWVFGFVAAAVGLASQIPLGLADARKNPGPAYGDPGFWAWVASPALAWMLACIAARKHRAPATVLAIGSVLSGLAGWALVWSDAHRTPTPGGMNPFASSGLTITMLLAGLLQWIIFLPFLCVAGLVWWYNRLPLSGSAAGSSMVGE